MGLNLVSAAAVIQHGDRILAIQRADNGHWEIPGGGIDPGEPPRDACAREVLEETGYLCRPTSISGVYYKAPMAVIELVFHAELEGSGPVQPSGPESQAVQWLTMEECEALMVPAFAIRVRDALEGSGVSLREHNGTVLDSPHDRHPGEDSAR